jgi:hypothetical protein
MYFMDKPSRWEGNLHLVEFAYNNGYWALLKMCPFKALHGIKCNTLVNWNNLEDIEVIELELLKKMEE